MTALGGLALLGACSNDEGAGDGGSSGTSGTSGSTPTISAADCKERCTAKLSSCGEVAAKSESSCTRLCGPGLTETQIVCIEDKDCETLDEAETADDICPRQSGGSSGNTSGELLPTTVTISGSFGTGRDPVRDVDVDGNTTSTLALEANSPTIAPTLPAGTLPDLAAEGITIRVDSPNEAECQPTISFTLSSTRLGVDVEGADPDGATDCVDFTDEIAREGLKATLSNVPYPSSKTKATVTLDLRP